MLNRKHLQSSFRVAIGSCALFALGAAVILTASVPAAAQEAISINESQALKAAILKPEPPYPPLAKQMKVFGTVSVTAVVDTEGKVEKVDIVSGNALLTKACVKAVEKWEFNPFQVEGKPVKAVIHLAFSFHL